MLKYWLWLSGCPVSPGAKAELIRRYGDAEAAFRAPEGEFARLERVSAAEAAILEARELDRARAIAQACRRQNISIVTMQDALYPKRLKNIYDPPVVLYVKGELPPVDENALVAVVGTRRASPYGLKMAKRLAFEITKCGGLVVSGLTAGIDAAAARGSLLAGGKCIGVLGTSHEQAEGVLAGDVAAKGALISEYAPGTVCLRHFFKERNRISAGLGVAALVVEAPEKSGALGFAREAVEQGKEIFAVPGNADSANSAGTIALLKAGALPVTEGWDVLKEFEGIFPDRLRPVKEAMPEQSTRPEQPHAEAPDKSPSEGRANLNEQLSQLNEQQLGIITAIDNDGMHIDDIMEATGLSAAKLMTQLTLLEIKGFLRRLPGNRVALNIAKK